MLSIIIPTLNEEKILSQTITALHNLNITDYEVIISDGHSTDGTVAIARSLADKVVVHDGVVRQTIAGGRNAGASEARGEYLVFIDADVFIPRINSFFERALDLFEHDDRLEGLTVFLKVLPEHVTKSDRLFFSIVNRINQFSNNFLHTGTSSGEFQMVRKSTFSKLGGYNEAMAVGEDNDFFSRISKIGKTRVATDLHVLHTSRRAHAVGWPSLLAIWIANFFYAKAMKKSMNSEWKVIR